MTNEINKIKLIHNDAIPEYTEEILCDPDCPITFIKTLISVWDTGDINVDIDMEDFLGAHDVAPEDIHNNWTTVGEFITDALEYFDYLVYPEDIIEHVIYV